MTPTNTARDMVMLFEKTLSRIYLIAILTLFFAHGNALAANPGYLLTNIAKPTGIRQSYLSGSPDYHVSTQGIIFYDAPKEILANLSNLSHDEYIESVKDTITIVSETLNLANPTSWLDAGLSVASIACVYMGWTPPPSEPSVQGSTFDFAIDQWSKVTSIYQDKGAINGPASIDGPGDIPLQIAYMPGPSSSMDYRTSVYLSLEIDGPNGVSTMSLGGFKPAMAGQSSDSPAGDDRMWTIGLYAPILSMLNHEGTTSGIVLLPTLRLNTPGTYDVTLYSNVFNAPFTCGGKMAEMSIEVGSDNFSSPPAKDTNIYTLGGGVYLSGSSYGNIREAAWEVFRVVSDEGTEYTPHTYTNNAGSNTPVELLPRDAPDGRYLIKGNAWYQNNHSFRFQYQVTLCGGLPQWNWDYDCPGDPLPDGEITITSPESGLSVFQTGTVPVTWNSAGVDQSTMKIELVSSSTTRTLAASADYAGTGAFQITTSDAPGTYRIRITSNADNRVSQTSAAFTIKELPLCDDRLCITFPEAGTELTPGNTYRITWLYDENSAVDDTDLWIKLYKGEAFHSGIRTVPLSQGYYDWEVPYREINDVVEGDDYAIDMDASYQNESGDTVRYAEDRSPQFSIGPAPTVTFISPQEGATLYAGQTYRFEWTMTGNNGTEASIELEHEASREEFLILDDGPNIRYFAWTVPETMPEGDYDAQLTTLTGLHTFVDNFFIVNKRTITALADQGGIISSAGAVQYGYGSSATYTIAANPHYDIIDVVVDGISQGPIASYQFDDITADHTIHALFEPVMHTLTVNAVGDGQGTISCTPDSVDLGNNQWSVPYGTIVTLVATPDDLSQFLKWTVDGYDAFGLQEEISITGDTSVTVAFALDSDQDGMSDAYERDNGLDPNSAIDRIADPDGDSLPNWMEHYLGTDPNDRYSRGTGRDDYWIIQPPVVASFDLAAFIDSDRLMHVWGRNATGLTAMEGDSGYSPPLEHSYGMRWKAVALGHDVVVAIKDDGTLWSWGEGEHGQLGDGTTEDRFNPACIDTRTDWIAIVAGDIDTESCFAINASGELWAWGDNEFNRLGLGEEASAVVLTPTKVDGEDWIRVFPDEEYVMGYTAGGGVMAWGHWFSDYPPGEFSELSAAGEGSPTPLNPISDVKLTEMHASGSTVVYMRNPGGLNARPSPDLTGHETGWASLALTFSELYGVKDDGSLWMINCWENGSILQIDDATDWLGVWSFRSSSGLSVTYAIKQDGSLHALGNNGSGLLGDGQAVSFVRPRKISDKTDWTHAAIGGVNVLAVDQAGRLWGSPKERGLLTENGFPLQESGSSLNFKRIHDTWAGSLALVDMDSGVAGYTPVRWSGGIFEPYGPNTASEIDSGYQALGSEDWVDLSQSIYAVQLRNTAGSVWNIYPMNTTDIYSDGQLIAEDVKPKGHVSIGDLQCYIKSDGTLWFDGSLWVENRPDQEWATWELLNYGEPTQIGTARWTQAAATLESATFLREDGTLWAVGGNKWWQLGCGDVESLDQLTQVGADSDWVSVFSAPKYTLAVKADGSLWGWGANGDNQLGAGTEFVMYPKKIDDGPWKPDGIFPSQGADANENSLLGIKTDGTLWMLGGVQCSSDWTVDVALNPGDADNDGIPDTVENCIGTNRDSDDSDGDGILDRQEDANANGVLDNGETDATDSDTDNDQMPDGWERLYNLDPLVADANDDADNDGMSNLAEYLEGTNPIVSNSAPSQTVPLPAIIELLFG